jgi:hypothetical protein
MATKKFDAAVSTGEYTDKKGVTKKRWMNVGVVMENVKGQLSLKLETVPVGPGWSGWISFFEPKQHAQTPAQEQHQQAKANGYVPEQDIPF